jgi:hypothetical protein
MNYSDNFLLHITVIVPEQETFRDDFIKILKFMPHFFKKKVEFVVHPF